MEAKEQEWRRETEAEIRADYAQVIPALESRDYHTAIEISRFAQERAHRSVHPLLEAEVTTQIGRAYRGLRNLDMAELYGYKAAIIAYPLAPKRANAALPVPLTFLGGILEERGSLAEARVVYQEAVENPLPPSQDPAYKNETRIRLYTVEYQLDLRSKESMIAESGEAIENRENGLAITKDAYARAVWISGSYHRIINALSEEDFDQIMSLSHKSREAINAYQLSDEFNETLDLTQRQEDWWKIAEKLPFNLNDLYVEAQNKRDAHRITSARIDYTHIRTLAEKSGNMTLSLYADQMLGLLLHMEGNYQKAIAHLSTVLQRAENAGNVVSQGDIERDIGWAYYRLGNLADSELHLQNSLNLLLPTENIQNYGISFVRLCIVQSERGTLANAINPLEETLQQMEKWRTSDIPTYYEFNGAKWLCRALVDTGEYEEARRIYNRSMFMKQQIETHEDKRFVDDTQELEELRRRIEEQN